MKSFSIVGSTSYTPAVDCPMPMTEYLSSIIVANYEAAAAAGVVCVYDEVADVTARDDLFELLQLAFGETPDSFIEVFQSLHDDFESFVGGFSFAGKGISEYLAELRAALTSTGGTPTSLADLLDMFLGLFKTTEGTPVSIADVVNSFFTFEGWDMNEVKAYSTSCVSVLRAWIDSAQAAYDAGLPIPTPSAMPDMSISSSSSGAVKIWIAAAKFLVQIVYALFMEWLFKRFFDEKIPATEDLERFLSEFVCKIDGRVDGVKVQLGSVQTIDD